MYITEIGRKLEEPFSKVEIHSHRLTGLSESSISNFPAVYAIIGYMKMITRIQIDR